MKRSTMYANLNKALKMIVDNEGFTEVTWAVESWLYNYRVTIERANASIAKDNKEYLANNG